MATRTETQVLWGGASSVTLTLNNTRSVSDAVAVAAAAWDGDLYLSAQNLGTPAAGDVVYFYIHYSAGDADGDTVGDFATNEYAEFLCALNTVPAETPGENPAARVIPIRVTAGAFKVSCQGAQVASRSITCRARLVTHES